MRHKVKPSKSRRMFTRTAGHTQSLNLQAVPMRGGFRL